MIDYKKSGVDIEAGDNLVSWLQNPQKSDSLAESSLQKNSDIPDLSKRVISGIGGFAALFDGKFPQMENPVLISCTDGVGTKVKLASYFGDYSTVGQDLVAMCANDLICTGGTPLFFLDYYACGKLDLNSAQQFLTSVKEACKKSHMVLIGGETAEMPGVYQEKDFDCAGFSVGVVDKEKIWGPDKVKQGDCVIGLASSGFHSNGYSLIRKVFENDLDNYKKWLLEPTCLYVEAALMLKKFFNIHAMAHITGGGIDNLPRVLPKTLKAQLHKWPLPDCFVEVQKRSQISDDEMRKTFNCGMGLMIILPESEAQEACSVLNKNNFQATKLGSVVSKQKVDDFDVEWL